MVHKAHLVASLALAALALATMSCATPAGPASAADGQATFEGTVAAIDTQPWTYDGNALVQVDTAARGRVEVQLPARWNLCAAVPVDVESLAVGMRVQVTGAETEGGAVVVCQSAAHRLVPVEATPRAP